MIFCLRTVAIPASERQRFLAWIEENRAVREQHGILLELVLEPTSGEGETVVITAWPSHEAFDAWISTAERDRITASDVHRAVDFRPIARYEAAGGYVNSEALKEASQ